MKKYFLPLFFWIPLLFADVLDSTLVQLQHATNNLPDNIREELFLSSSRWGTDFDNAFFSYIKLLVQEIKTVQASTIADIIDLVRYQLELEHTLNQNTEWTNGITARSPLIEIQIQQLHDLDSEQYTLNATQLANFAKVFSRSLEYLGLPLENGLLDAVTKELRQLGENLLVSTDSYIAGLSFGLKGSDRHLPETIKEIVEHFQKLLPEKLGPSFKSEKLGLSTDQRDEVLKAFERTASYEQKFKDLFLLYSYLKIKGDLAIQEVKLLASSFDQGSFESIFNGHRNELLSQTELFIKNRNVSKNIQQKILQEIKDVFKGQEMKTVTLKNENLILREVPPYLAIARGFVGGDCATSYSWPYPNNYTDRVFFIYSKDKYPIGYLSAIVLKVDGKKTLYIHTINGVDIATTSRASLILNTFIENATALGVEQVALSSDIDELINFEVIKKAFEEFIGSRENVDPKRIVFIDRNVRKIVEAFHKDHVLESDGHYDSMTNMKKHLVLVTKKIEKEFKTKVAINDLSYQYVPSESNERLLPKLLFIKEIRENSHLQTQLTKLLMIEKKFGYKNILPHLDKFALDPMKKANSKVAEIIDDHLKYLTRLEESDIELDEIDARLKEYTLEDAFNEQEVDPNIYYPLQETVKWLQKFDPQIPLSSNVLAIMDTKSPFDSDSLDKNNNEDFELFYLIPDDYESRKLRSASYKEKFKKMKSMPIELLRTEIMKIANEDERVIFPGEFIFAGIKNVAPDKFDLPLLKKSEYMSLHQYAENADNDTLATTFTLLRRYDPQFLIDTKYLYLILDSKLKLTDFYRKEFLIRSKEMLYHSMLQMDGDLLSMVATQLLEIAPLTRFPPDIVSKINSVAPLGCKEALLKLTN